MGPLERQRDARVRPARDPCAGRCRLRRRGTPERTAALAVGAGQRHRHRQRRLGRTGPGRGRARTDDPAAAEPRRRSSRACARARGPLDVVMVAANLTDRNSELVVRGPGTEDSMEDLSRTATARSRPRSAPAPTGSAPPASPRQARAPDRRQLPRLLPERRSAALARPPGRRDARARRPADRSATWVHPSVLKSPIVAPRPVRFRLTGATSWSDDPVPDNRGAVPRRSARLRS